MPLRGCRQTRLDSKGRMLTRRFLNLLTCRLAETNLAGSAFTFARFLNSNSMGVTLSPGSVCIRFWMCWWRFRAGTSVLPDRTAWNRERNVRLLFTFRQPGVIYLIVTIIYWLLTIIL